MGTKERVPDYQSAYIVRYNIPVSEVIMLQALLYGSNFDACFGFSGTSTILLRKVLVMRKVLFSVN